MKRKRYLIADGERRWRAAKLLGIQELDCIVLEKKPSAAELVALQLAMDVHRKNLSPIERAGALKRLMDETGDSLTLAAERIGMSQSLASKLMGYQRLCPEAQEMLNVGKLDMEKAYVVSQFDHAKQAELLKEAGTLTRDQLRNKARGIEPKAKSARFALTSGFSVAVHGREFALPDAITAIQEVLKELRQAQKDRLDVTTVVRVMADRAKGAS